jgi:putative flippase GtrA
MSAGELDALLQRVWSHSFFRFAIVGFTGFAVDYLLLRLQVNSLGAPPVPARFVSFSVALFCTWALNRLWSFAAHRSERVLSEAGRYVMVQLTGGALNLGVYALLVTLVPAWRHAVLIPLAAGSAVGLGVNYAGSRLLVFRGNR